MEVNKKSNQNDFQVVLVIEGDDGRFYPLTEEVPRCLLPIANRKLLAYQLDMLNKSGACEIILVGSADHETQLRQFLAEYIADNINIDLVTVESLTDSAEGLRAVADRIRGDFIFMTADSMTQMCLGELVQLHKSRVADVTMLLAAAPIDEPEKKGGPKKIRIDEDDQEIIALNDENRVIFKTSILNIEEHLDLSKGLLQRAGGCTTVRHDLIDMSIYVFSHWVVSFVVSNSKISCIRSDLIPFLVHRQFVGKAKIYEDIPDIRGKSAEENFAIENWLVTNGQGSKNIEYFSNINNDGRHRELVSLLSEEISMKLDSNDLSRASTLEQLNLRPGPLISIPSNVSLTGLQSPGVKDSKKTSTNMYDVLRCYAQVVETENVPDFIMQRLVTLSTYTQLNRDIPSILWVGPGNARNPQFPWNRSDIYQKKELTVLSDQVDIGDKVTYKQCCLGKGVKVGVRSKLNNCVVMDNVVIAENCTIQNSVLCSGVVIEANCNLNECFIGPNSTVTAGSKLKSEQIAYSNL